MNEFSRHIFCSVALIFTFTCIVKTQTKVALVKEEKPKVVRAAAPKKFPQAARAVNAGGYILVEVEINSAGNVISENGLSGHPLLQAASKEAARRWIFEPIADEKLKRKATLTFFYKTAEKNEDAGVFFSPPYKIEFISIMPELIN